MKNIKWDTFLSILALLISLTSLFFTFQIEKSKSSPNVQIQSVYGGRTVELGDETDNITIDSTITLINVGNAPTQIVDVKWEMATSAENDFDGLLAISDTLSPSDSRYNEYFKSIRNLPVEGIEKNILESGQILELKLFFRSTPVPKNDTNLRNIRVIFTFSNGQQLTVLPELRYFGARRTF